MPKFCLLLCCLSNVFEGFHKIRRDFVVCFQNLADEKVLQVFGCSPIDFTCDRQPYDFAEHSNRNNTDYFYKYPRPDTCNQIID